jgi:hypothetical protein
MSVLYGNLNRQSKLAVRNGAIYCTQVARRANVSLETMAKTARRQTGEDEGRQNRPGLVLRTRAQADRAGTGTHAPVQERCGSSVTSLSLSTIRPSSGSERAFILCIALLRWTFTVASAMPISPAICLLRRPRAT